MDENDVKNKARGTSIEIVAVLDGIDITAELWKYNKSVILLPEIQFSNVNIYDMYLDVVQYNKHVGGVDLLDSLIGWCKIRIRTKKLFLCLFYHLLDMAIINSSLIWKSKTDQKKKDILLAGFSADIAYAILICLIHSKDVAPQKNHLSWVWSYSSNKKDLLLLVLYLYTMFVLFIFLIYW